MGTVFSSILLHKIEVITRYLRNVHIILGLRNLPIILGFSAIRYPLALGLPVVVLFSHKMLFRRYWPIFWCSHSGCWSMRGDTHWLMFNSSGAMWIKVPWSCVVGELGSTSQQHSMASGCFLQTLIHGGWVGKKKESVGIVPQSVSCLAKQPTSCNRLWTSVIESWSNNTGFLLHLWEAWLANIAVSKIHVL